tara:strand:- start:126 stop:320 length:195 start_codon:yes stop_codon:yes gene_type:complete
MLVEFKCPDIYLRYISVFPVRTPAIASSMLMDHRRRAVGRDEPPTLIPLLRRVTSTIVIAVSDL